MSYEPGRWWLGLLPLGIFWVLGTGSTTGDVEADLAGRSKAALGADLVDKPTVEVAGRDVTLGGVAFAPSGARSAIQAVRSLNGVRLVNHADLGLVAEAKPYAWTAKRDGAKVALGGAVPDPAARTAVNASAKGIAGAEVADGMGYARGDTSALAAGSAFALGELARFSKGAASLSDGALTLSGLAANFPSYEQALAALKSPPAGVTIAKAEVTAPLVKPYVFSAANGDGSLKLTGVAPSYPSRDAIAAAAANLFPHAKIDNALTIASGAPKGDFDAAAKFALAELGGLSQGSATLTDGALTLGGIASGPDAYERALGGLKAPPEGLTVAKADVTPPLAKPFVFAAASGGGAVRLAGAAPSLASRDAIAAMAGKIFPGAAIDNALTIASGAPSGDFEGAVRFALASMANLEGARATLTDNTLTISGKARAPGAIEALEKSASGLAPGFTLAKTDIAPATVNPFVFSASSAPGKVSLSGVAPSAASRDAIAAAAARLFPGATIEDGLLIAGGAPTGDFDSAAIFALSQIANLDEGKAVLTDAALSISGRARAPGAIEALDKAASTLASGFTLASAEVAPAEVHPYVFTASKTADGVKLTGFVPSLAARRQLAADAAQAAAGKPVVDETQIAAGLPQGVDFAAVAQFAVTELSRLTTGEAKLADSDFSLRATASDVAGAEAAKSELGGLPAGVHVVDTKIEAPASAAAPAAPVAAPAPAAVPAAPVASADWDNVAADAASASVGPALDASACEAGFKDSLESAKIEFDTDQATISPASYALIVKLAGIALRCQVPQIEISGHTDNTGDDSINQPLSQARAEAVANVLVKAGVPVSRLSAVGYGATNPIAPNDTEEGRAKNRRIEFEVKS